MPPLLSLGALSNRNFRWLQAGSVVSNIGTFFEQVAQSWLVYHLTGSAAWVGLHSFAINAPTLLTSLPAGAWADQSNRRRMLLRIMGTWALVGLAFAVLSGVRALTPGVIVGLTLLEGFCAAASRPFWNAATKDIVGKRDLGSAIAFNSAGFNLARMIGPALGGIVLDRYGPTASFSVNAASFAVILTAIWRLRLPPQRVRPRRPIAREIGRAMRFGIAHPGLFRLYWGSAAFAFLTGPMQGILVVFAAEALGGDARAYGNLLSCLAVGALVGALIAGKGPKYYPRHHLIPLAALLYGVFGLAFSMSRSMAFAAPFMAAVGVFHSSFFISSMTAVQLLSPDPMRARLVSVQSMMTMGFMPLGSAVGGLVANRLTAPTTLTMFMAAMLVLGVYLVRNRVPAIEPEHRHSGVVPRPGFWEGVTAGRHRAG